MVLSRFTVTFDYSRKVMYLRRNANLEAPFEANLAGLGIGAEGDDLRVRRVVFVRDGSAALRAGIQTGDVIAEVNGRQAGDLSMAGIREVMRQPGTELRLVVLRGDQRIPFTLRLEREV